MEARILWADDEIDLLKPHILFLEQKGYKVEISNNGRDAAEMAKNTNFDIIFLDENMPGYSGLETLAIIKQHQPQVPVIMITKSEEEHIMEEAIGGQISDYLIKPVNPNQILLSLKKNLRTKELVSQKNTADYQSEFRQIGMQLNERLDFNEWTDIYKTLVNWELKLDNSGDSGMKEVFDMQKREANTQFSKFVTDNYEDWVSGHEEAPIMSHNVLAKKVMPFVGKEPIFRDRQFKV